MSQEFKVHTYHNCIDSYKDPEDLDAWLPCSNCKLKPKVWNYNWGSFTACGCWDNTYRHFTIEAESIGICLHRDRNFKNHDSDGLRKNWNHWVKTGEFNYVYNRQGIGCVKFGGSK